MGSINDQIVTDNVTDVLAAQYNTLLGSIIRSDWSNATTMSGTVTLTDSDYALQRFNCNGANRIVKLPAYSTSNHPYFIINTTATTYTLDVQSNAGVTILTTPLAANGGNVLVMPDGVSGFYAMQSGGGTWGSITGTLSSQTDLLYAIEPQQGVVRNGKLSVTVASNNLIVALKTLAGNDPSASEPVRVYLGGAWRSVTAALSVTLNAGANSFNSGSAEFATVEIDYFVYLGYNATDGVVIGFARIPFGCKYADFNTTATNEKYCKISTITNAAANDEYAVMGRFAATLSAGAGYTWTVPTFTPSNLIQHPIWNTRQLSFTESTAAGNVTSGGGALTTVTSSCSYMVVQNEVTVSYAFTLTNIGTGTGALKATQPFLPVSQSACGGTDANTGKSINCLMVTTSPSLAIKSYDGTTDLANGNNPIISTTYFI